MLYSRRATLATSGEAASLPWMGLTTGVGLSYRRPGVDFAFEPMAELGQVYRITLGLRW